MLQETSRSKIAHTLAQRWRLDDVITLFRDSAKTFRSASTIPSAHRDELVALSGRRSAFAHRLSTFTRDPEAANTRGSFAGLARRSLFDVRAWLLGQSHLGDSLAACLRAETRAAQSLTRALDLDWHADVAVVLEEQLGDIDATSSRVRAIRGRL